MKCSCILDKLIIDSALLHLSVDGTNDVNELVRGECHNETNFSFLHRNSAEISNGKTL